MDTGRWAVAASNAWPGFPAGARDWAMISLETGVPGVSVSCVEQADNPPLGDVHIGFLSFDREFGGVIEAKGEADPANAAKALDVTARYGHHIEFVGRA